MNEQNTFSDPKRLLVAYLKGELTDQQVTFLIQQMNTNSQFQDQLDILCVQMLDKIKNHLMSLEQAD